jgi:hypothetical protein
MNTQLLTRSITAALVVAAIMAPAAGAEPVQQRFASPDAMDRNTEAQRQDLRGADARGVPTDAPDIRVVRITQPAPAPSSADGAIDWPDALLGAGGALGLTLLGLGGTLAIVHHRRPQMPA